MEVALNVVLKDAYGEDFKLGDTVLTLEKALYQALVAVTEKDKNIDGEEKYKRHKLTEKIVGKESADLSIEELAKLKDLTGKLWGVGLVGAIWDILEAK